MGTVFAHLGEMGMQIEGLVGAKEVLKTVPEKSSFLQCLHAKDCLRLLGMVCSPLGFNALHEHFVLLITVHLHHKCFQLWRACHPVRHQSFVTRVC